MAAADTARLVAELTLDAKGFQRGMAAAQKSLGGLDKATSRTQKSLGKTAGNIGKGFAIATAAVAAGGIAVINAASDYESAFAGVRKTVDASEEDLQKLSQGFRDLAKTIPISASELAALGETAGALGIEGVDNIKEFARVTALLGVTTDLTAEDAANSLGVLSNVLGLTSKEYSQFASALVALGNAGASTESQIIAIAERAGGAGELIGLTTEQVLGLSSAVASLGIESEAGGSSLQKFFLETAGFAAKGGKELELMAKIAGTSAKQFKKVFDKDAGKALQRFLANLGKLSEGDQIRALEELGFSEVRISRTLLGLAGNADLVAESFDTAEKAFKDNNALTKEAAERFKTFDSQLQITKNVLNDVAITIGSKLLPKITPLLQRFNEFVNNNQPAIEKFGEDAAAAFEQFADSVAKVDWTPFIDGLKFTAEVGKQALGIFQSMPDWLQKLIVAGFAVNKLTGGLVTSLGKDIFGAAGAHFFARGASPANPLFVSAVGGVGAGGPAGAAGSAGKLATVASAVGKVFIVGAAVAFIHELANIRGQQSEENKAAAAGVVAQSAGFANSADIEDMRDSLKGLRELQHKLTYELTPEAIAYQLDIDGVKTALEKSIANVEAGIATYDRHSQASAFAIRDAVNQKIGFLGGITASVRDAVNSTTAAARAAGQQTAFAIRDKDLSVDVTNAVTVNTSVSVRETSKTQTTYKQFSRYIS